MQHGLTDADWPSEDETTAPQAEKKYRPEIEWLRATPPYVPWGLDMDDGLAALRRAKTLTDAEKDVLRIILVAALNYRQPYGKTTKATAAGVEVRLSHGELAQRTGVSGRTAGEAARKLQRLGLVGARQARGGHVPTVFLVTAATFGRIRAAAEGGTNFHPAKHGTNFHPRVEGTSTLESDEARPGRGDGALIKEGNTLPGRVRGETPSTQSTGGARVQKLAQSAEPREPSPDVIERAQLDKPVSRESARGAVSDSKPLARSEPAQCPGGDTEAPSRPSQALTGASPGVDAGQSPGRLGESAMEAVCELLARHDRGEYQHRPKLHDEIARLVASSAPYAEQQLLAISRRMGVTGSHLEAVVNDPEEVQVTA